MATRKEKIDIENEEQLSSAPAAEEGQDPASWVPPFTVRVYPLSNPKTKLLATASITIAGSFAVKGFRIYDSKNGLFVKDPERRYVKNGTELTDSVFFPITKEARDILHGQILSSYELVMEQQERQHPQQKDELEELLEDDLPFDTAYQSAPLPTDEDAPVMTM
ncbi:septation protein SpoVG family protein [Neglectibacter timonensis]|uniref:septation protein SpoVG family protein n=1 Tax=Oscillospiraceae TaxID=216572 RepID=UPI003995768E